MIQANNYLKKEISKSEATLKDALAVADSESKKQEDEIQKLK